MMNPVRAADTLLKLIDPGCLNLVLVRHGQPDGTVRCPGLIGGGLSRLGRRQAARLATRLAALPLDCVYTSDMARAHQTAEAVCAFHPRAPFRVLPDIREISVFQVAGMPPARTAEERRRLHEERARVRRFARLVRRQHKPGQLIAMIAHNGVCGMLLAELSGLAYRRLIPFVIAHTGVSVAAVAAAPPVVTLRLMGCCRHLGPEMVSYAGAPKSP